MMVDLAHCFLLLALMLSVVLYFDVKCFSGWNDCRKKMSDGSG